MSNQRGLMHNEFNTISHYQAPDGRLYFGGQNGVVHFDPEDFQDKTQVARKELESGIVLSITEVAFNNAFEFPAIFSTVFKKQFGVSPSDYLKHVQGISK